MKYTAPTGNTIAYSIRGMQIAILLIDNSHM